jgi:hypothetical protein
MIFTEGSSYIGRLERINQLPMEETEANKINPHKEKNHGQIHEDHDRKTSREHTDEELFGDVKLKKHVRKEDWDEEDQDLEKDVEENREEAGKFYMMEPVGLYRAINGKWEEMDKGYLKCAVLKVTKAKEKNYPPKKGCFLNFYDDGSGFH